MAYTVSFEEFKDIWDQEPLVVIDTNGLLNLYRFSPETTNHILKVLDRICDNLWIPDQVLQEYQDNHSDVVKREFSKYKEVSKEVERIMLISKNDISKQFIKFSKFRFPKVNELNEKINNAIESVRLESKKFEDEIKVEVKKNEKMLKDDNVLLFVQRLVKNKRIGDPFPLSKLLKIFEEGEKRYFYKIPPGYMDINKDDKDKTKRKKFGDLILWKQILEKAHQSNSPVIFVTLDEKEDWWILDKDGQPERPREELFLEFKEYSSKELIILNLPAFIDHVSVINNMVDHITHLELNAEDVSMELLEKEGWDTTLDDGLNLTSYLIHSGDLQPFIDNPLSDVEIQYIELPSLSIDSTEIDENNVVIEGTFNSLVEASVTESFSKYYSEDLDVSVQIKGSISLEFEVDFEKEKDFIKTDSVVITVGGFEVVGCSGYEHEYDEDERCTRCKKPNAYLFSSDGDAICQECSVHFEICPRCSKLFDSGTLGGAFCSDCSAVS